MYDYDKDNTWNQPTHYSYNLPDNNKNNGVNVFLIIIGIVLVVIVARAVIALLPVLLAGAGVAALYYLVKNSDNNNELYKTQQFLEITPGKIKGVLEVDSTFNINNETRLENIVVLPAGTHVAIDKYDAFGTGDIVEVHPVLNNTIDEKAVAYVNKEDISPVYY